MGLSKEERVTDVGQGVEVVAPFLWGTDYGSGVWIKEGSSDVWCVPSALDAVWPGADWGQVALANAFTFLYFHTKVDP